MSEPESEETDPPVENPLHEANRLARAKMGALRRLEGEPTEELVERVRAALQKAWDEAQKDIEAMDHIVNETPQTEVESLRKRLRYAEQHIIGLEIFAAAVIIGCAAIWAVKVAS